jgi:hypothetical protein
VTDDLSDPQGVAFDPFFRRIYWADRGTGKIQRVDPGSILVEDVVTGLAAPKGVAVDPGDGDLQLELNPASATWQSASGANRFDVVTGDLVALRAAAGDYSTAGIACLGEVAGTTTAWGEAPGPGEGLFMLVRPSTSTGNGTYDSLGHRQVGARDGEVDASGADCP